MMDIVKKLFHLHYNKDVCMGEKMVPWLSESSFYYY